MPAVSKAQQRFFGMVRATQKGEMENPSPEVAKVAATAKRSDVKDFASTEHKGLPMRKTFKEFYELSEKKKESKAKRYTKKTLSTASKVFGAMDGTTNTGKIVAV